MEKANTLPVYWLGFDLGVLHRALASPSSAWELIEHAIEAKKSLNGFINDPVVSQRVGEAAKLILQAIEGFIKKQPAIKIMPKSVTEEEIRPILNFIRHFNSVIISELPSLNIFYATQKLGYDMALLIEQGEANLPKEVVKVLGSDAKIIKEVKAAARCLAFGIPTAVGFHLYRGIESIIIEEYFPLLGITEDDYENKKNLGKYIEFLEKKEVDSKITSMLRHIKDEYRNSISHPDEFWGITEAAIAFGAAMSVIPMMVQDIQARKVTSPSVPASS